MANSSVRNSTQPLFPPGEMLHNLYKVKFDRTDCMPHLILLKSSPRIPRYNERSY